MSVETTVGFMDKLQELKRQQEARQSLPGLEEKKGQLEWKLRGINSCLEQIDAEMMRLEGSFIASLFGGKEQKLEAKRQEAGAMQRQRDECASELQTVLEELAAVERQLTDPHELEQEISRLYESKAKDIIAGGGDVASQLEELDRARNGAKIHRQEVNKAERVAKILLERFFGLTKSVGKARTSGVSSSAVGALAATAMNTALEYKAAKPAVTRVRSGLDELTAMMGKLQIPEDDRRSRAMECLLQEFASSAEEMEACGVGGMVAETIGANRLLDTFQDAVSLLKELSNEAEDEADTWEGKWRCLVEQS